MLQVHEDELARVVSAEALQKVLSSLPDSGRCFVPDWTKLRLGDVILSSHRTNYPTELVFNFQLAVDFLPDHARWTHAMVYIGDMMVAESNVPVKGSIDPDREKGGTLIKPLSEYVPTHDLLVCRLSDSQFSEEARKEAADYAVNDVRTRPRLYSMDRIIEIVLSLPFRPPEAVATSVICSDFALQVLAVGGAVLVEDYNAVLEHRHDFLPADFCVHPSFTHFELGAVELLVRR